MFFVFLLFSFKKGSFYFIGFFLVIKVFFLIFLVVLFIRSVILNNLLNCLYNFCKIVIKVKY